MMDVFYLVLQVRILVTVSFAPILGTRLSFIGDCYRFFSLVSYEMIYYAMLHIINLKHPFIFLQKPY